MMGRFALTLALMIASAPQAAAHCFRYWAYTTPQRNCEVRHELRATLPRMPRPAPAWDPVPTPAARAPEDERAQAIETLKRELAERLQ
jgi:hypothetical protein